MADRAIFIVGVGGTGGLLVPKLAKMLINTNIDLWLIDGDTVESKNVERQPYQDFNTGEKKATALARKVMSCYDVNTIEFPFYLTENEIRKIIIQKAYSESVIIGCVDNHSTRILLENQFKQQKNCIYIDSANGEEDGSIFIAKHTDKIQGDLRSDLFPEIKQAKDHPTGTCQAAIEKGNFQQMVTNDLMANSIAKLVYMWLLNDLKTGVIKIDGFERIFITD